MTSGGAATPRSGRRWQAPPTRRTRAACRDRSAPTASRVERRRGLPAPGPVRGHRHFATDVSGRQLVREAGEAVLLAVRGHHRRRAPRHGAEHEPVRVARDVLGHRVGLPALTGAVGGVVTSRRCTSLLPSGIPRCGRWKRRCGGFRRSGTRVPTTRVTCSGTCVTRPVSTRCRESSTPWPNTGGSEGKRTQVCTRTRLWLPRRPCTTGPWRGSFACSHRRTPWCGRYVSWPPSRGRVQGRSTGYASWRRTDITCGCSSDTWSTRPGSCLFTRRGSQLYRNPGCRGPWPVWWTDSAGRLHRTWPNCWSDWSSTAGRCPASSSGRRVSSCSASRPCHNKSGALSWARPLAAG